MVDADTLFGATTDWLVPKTVAVGRAACAASCELLNVVAKVGAGANPVFAPMNCDEDDDDVCANCEVGCD